MISDQHLLPNISSSEQLNSPETVGITNTYEFMCSVFISCPSCFYEQQSLWTVWEIFTEQSANPHSWSARDSRFTTEPLAPLKPRVCFLRIFCENVITPTEAEIDPTQLSFWVASSRILMCVCKVVVNLLVIPLCSRLLYAEGVLVQSTEETALWPLLLFQHQHFPCFRVLPASTNNQWVKTHPCGRGERDT